MILGLLLFIFILGGGLAWLAKGIMAWVEDGVTAVQRASQQVSSFIDADSEER